MKTITAGLILLVAGALSIGGCSILPKKKEIGTTDYNLLAVYQDTSTKQYVLLSLQFHSLKACTTEMSNLLNYSEEVCKKSKDGCFQMMNAVCIDSQTGNPV